MTSPFKKREKAIETTEIACCPVCFKDVEIFSIGICDHPICHECSTRMRVLCKEDACPICRQELTKVWISFTVIWFWNLKNYGTLKNSFFRFSLWRIPNHINFLHWTCILWIKWLKFILRMLPCKMFLNSYLFTFVTHARWSLHFKIFKSLKIIWGKNMNYFFVIFV